MRLLALLGAGFLVLQMAAASPWTLQSSGIASRLRGVSVVSGSVAWASGANGTVLRTVDAGATWQHVIVPDTAALDFRDVDAMDARTAYVLSIGPGEASRIYKTVDGGARWETQFANHDPKAFFDGMAFSDAEHGLAVSDSVDGRFLIVRTENGGRTWTPVEPAGLPPSLAGEGAFAASGTSVAVHGPDHAWIGTGASTAARVLRSSDGGRTWTVSTTPLPAGPSAGIFSVAFADTMRGIVVGGDYKQEGAAVDNVAVTIDGGATWSRVAPPALSGFRSAVAVVPGTVSSAGFALLAVGPSGGDVSHDGGRHWASLGSDGFHALSMSRDGVAWAVGENGRIARLEWAKLAVGVSPPQTTTASGDRRPQTQADDYTSYELLAPETQQFRILYDVTATTPGAKYFFNPIRKGSEASDERVIDPVSGAPLAFEVVSGASAREQGDPGAALDTDYIRVTLPRPVPANGEVRLRIDKTYKDAKSYYRDGDTIVFARSLGIKRNKVVLPAGYELVGCNVPSQIFTQADGRLAVSFMNANPGAADLMVRARGLPAGTRMPAPAARGRIDPKVVTTPLAPTAPGVAEPTLEQSAAQTIGERAFQDREIVYFLQPPATHAFDLYHDYTESRPGTSTYVNVVRAGSRASNPSAINLDTGETLSVETVKGAAITAAKVPMEEPVTADTEVVVIRFPAVKAGQSTRLRISETYTDPARYGLVGDALVWRRSFGRPRNAMVLPEGWLVTASTIPATVSLTDDGRVRLDYVNARPDNIDVLVRGMARRR